MNIPALQGIIRRRILLNYSVEPDVARELVPKRFSLKLVSGYALAGICLIRLESIRPKTVPLKIGISSENSALRIAVEWTDNNGLKQEGVFVPRRDTDSRLNSLAGGRIFPGVHHLSRFEVHDSKGSITLRIASKDYATPLVDLMAHETEEFSPSSVFASLSESSAFFERGCIGYSARPNSCTLDGLSLRVSDWHVSPLAVDFLHSAYYDDHSVFPLGSIKFDHALIMRDIRHEWHSQDAITTEETNSEQTGAADSEDAAR